MRRIKMCFPFAFVIICMAIFAMPAYAFSEAYFDMPKNAVNTGEDFSVTLNFSAEENIGKINVQLSYDPNVIEFTSGTDASAKDGMITINSNVGGASSKNFTLSFRAKKQGNSTINIVSSKLNDMNGGSIGSPTAYINVTTVGEDVGTSTQSSQTETSKPAESVTEQTAEEQMPTSGVLSSITVDNGELSPKFAWNIYEYTVNVGNEVTNVEIDAASVNESDYIWYSGSSECQVGENIRTITVSDSAGGQRVYTIKIIRAEEEEQTTVSVVEKERHIPQPKENKSEDIFSRHKSLINSALILILLVLFIALGAIICWIKNRSNKK